MFTLQKGNKTLSLMHKGENYVIGFKKVTHARNVQYRIHPEPMFNLTRGAEIDVGTKLYEEGFGRTSLVLDPCAILEIPKYYGSPSDPMNDGFMHMNTVSTLDFMTYPLTKMLGIIILF